jgi:tRNA pseudouridine55 synthase
MVTNQTTDFSTLDFASGEIILIDKPIGWTSFKVVSVIRKSTKVKKVGHSGTLDPMATGLLIICTGKKTKDISKFLGQDKTYTGVISLGKTSPSMDKETEITEMKIDENINRDIIINTAKSFVGEIEQIPPMYSAIKINGKRLYKLARKGIEVERQPRKVKINSFEIKNVQIPDVEFEVNCSKGTYIRVLANDLGQMLGCGGILSELRRTEIGEFKAENALKVEEFVEKAKKS